MTRVVCDISVSADGYSAGHNQTEERPFDAMSDARTERADRSSHRPPAAAASNAMSDART